MTITETLKLLETEPAERLFAKLYGEDQTEAARKRYQTLIKHFEEIGRAHV